MIPQLEAVLWGLATSSVLVIGAIFGYFFNIGQRYIAAIMAFRSGVLISILSFDLMDKAFETGEIMASFIDFYLLFLTKNLGYHFDYNIINYD